MVWYHVSMGDDSWVTVSEAIRLLGKSEQTIRRWIKAGSIPVDKTHGITRIDISGHIPDGEQPESTRWKPSPDVTAIMTENAVLKERVDRLQAENAELWQTLREMAPKQLPPPARGWRWPWER